MSNKVHHTINEAQKDIDKGIFMAPWEKAKCVNCEKDLGFLYDGGSGEYGVYVMCKDCDKIEFDWQYVGP